jgi:replicative DNA helicase
MADLGRALISKILLEDDLASAVESGVRHDWFEEPEHAKAYKWLTEYFSRYSVVPTPRALRTQFPNYKIIKVPEPYAYYTDKFRELHERAIIFDAISGAHDALEEDDPKKAQKFLSEGLLRIGKEVGHLSDENLTSKLRTRYDDYEESRKHAGEITGIATGFYTLDLSSGGYHPQQFILFGGAPKQCKSYMLMKSAIAAHDQGKRVLFISFEMSVKEQRVRHDGIRCGLNSEHLMHGTLEDWEMTKLKRGFRVLQNTEPFMISADISATTTASGLAAKIDQHDPDIVFVDGVYLMESETGVETGTTQAYTSVSRALKRLAQRTEIPVVGTVQSLLGKMKDGNVTMSSLGWTSAWAQDADVILGVEKVTGTPNLRVRVVGGRSISDCEMSIACDWEESRFEEVAFDEDDEDD